MKVHESWIIHKKRNYIILMINWPTPGWKFAIYSISYLKFGYATNGDHNEVAFHHKLISSITRAWNRHMNHNLQYTIWHMYTLCFYFSGIFHGHRKKKVGINSTETCQELVQTDYPTPTRDIIKVPCKKHSVFVTIWHPLVLCERTTVWIQWILSRD